MAVTLTGGLPKVLDPGGGPRAAPPKPMSKHDQVIAALAQQIANSVKNVKPVHQGQFPEYHASYGNPLAAAAYNPVLGPLMGVLNYAANKLSPTVSSGRKFTAVDGQIQPRLTAAVGDVLHAVAAGDQYNHMPTRVFKQAVLDGSGPITQQSFKPNELDYLRTAVSRAQAAGHNAISYNDYLNPEFLKYRAARAEGAPMQMKAPKIVDTGGWNQTVGRARIEQRPDGVHVVDSYDFNNYEANGSTVGKSNTVEDFTENSMMSPAYAAAWFGRRALPSGLRSVPVDINLGMGKR